MFHHIIAFITHEDFREIRRNYDEQIESLNQKVRKLSESNHDQVVTNLLKEQQEKSQKSELQLRNRISELEEEVVSLRSRLIEKENELSKLTTSNQAAQAEIQQLKTQLQNVPPSLPNGGPPPPPPLPDGSPPSLPDGGPPPPPPLPDGGPPPPPPLPDGGPPPPPFLPDGGPPLPPGMPPPLPGMPPSPAAVIQNIPGLPPKHLIKPSKKMKHLNWKKIPNNKILATIWGEAKDEISINTKELEELFAAKPSNAPKLEAKKAETEQKLVNLIDAKRANHVGMHAKIYLELYLI